MYTIFLVCGLLYTAQGKDTLQNYHITITGTFMEVRNCLLWLNLSKDDNSLRYNGSSLCFAVSSLCYDDTP